MSSIHKYIDVLFHLKNQNWRLSFIFSIVGLNKSCIPNSLIGGGWITTKINLFWSTMSKIWYIRTQSEKRNVYVGHTQNLALNLKCILLIILSPNDLVPTRLIWSGFESWIEDQTSYLYNPTPHFINRQDHQFYENYVISRARGRYIYILYG